MKYVKTFQLMYFRALLQAALVGRMGNSFQEFFVSCARKKWGLRFETIRPYGNIGDRKCDGRIREEGRFFQSYAPYSAVGTKIHAKVEGDFEGALSEWGSEIKRWTFVINDREGLDAASDAEVEKLRKKYPHVIFDVLGPQEFEEMVLRLDPPDVADLFGVSIEELDPRQWTLSFEEIAKVLERIDLAPAVTDESSTREPPLNKIEINHLPADVAEIINKSDVNTEQVERFFRSVPDVDLEGRVAHAMRSLYKALKAIGHAPDEIFYKIVSAIGILEMPSRSRIAGFALITYFFRGCVIFEESEAVA